MKQSFLNSLVGMPIDRAKDKVRKQNHICMIIPKGGAVCLALMVNTVILWEKDGIVEKVSTGDNSKIIKDV